MRYATIWSNNSWSLSCIACDDGDPEPMHNLFMDGASRREADAELRAHNASEYHKQAVAVYRASHGP